MKAHAHAVWRSLWTIIFLTTLTMWTTQASHAEVVAVGGWSRSTPPMAPVGIAYLQLENRGPVPVSVKPLACDAAATVELHETVTEGGVARMRELTDGIRIEAGQTLQMRPGGVHLMLIGLSHALVAGSTVNVEMQVSDGSRVKAAAEVRASTAK